MNWRNQWVVARWNGASKRSMRWRNQFPSGGFYDDLFGEFDSAATTYEVTVLKILNYSAENLNGSDKEILTNPFCGLNRGFLYSFFRSRFSKRRHEQRIKISFCRSSNPGEEFRHL